MLHVWNIYLQNWASIGVNVGKYSSTMEHMGMDGLLWSRKSSLCATRRVEASQLVNQLDKARRRERIAAIAGVMPLFLKRKHGKMEISWGFLMGF